MMILSEGETKKDIILSDTFLTCKMGMTTPWENCDFVQTTMLKSNQESIL
jgi:hypothetical protein